MRLYALVLFQCCVIVWLHFLAVRRNLEYLRAYLALNIANSPDLWVDGGPHRYSFHMCAECADVVTMGS